MNFKKNDPLYVPIFDHARSRAYYKLLSGKSEKSAIIAASQVMEPHCY